MRQDKRKESFFEPVDIIIIVSTTLFFMMITGITAYFYGQNNPIVIGGHYSFWDVINFWTSFAYANWILFFVIWAGIGFLVGFLIILLMNYFRK